MTASLTSRFIYYFNKAKVRPTFGFLQLLRNALLIEMFRMVMMLTVKGGRVVVLLLLVVVEEEERVILMTRVVMVMKMVMVVTDNRVQSC